MMQKSSIKIRIAEISDISAIAGLEKMCFSSPWSENSIQGTMSGENALFLVAEKYGSVCGYIGAYYVLDEGYITNIAVNPDYRRQGIGRELLCELIERGEALALKFWTLEVRTGNTGAIALYKNMGFESVGIRPRFYSNPTEDAALMTFYIGKERRL